MRSRVFFVALLALACAARAETVSSDDARVAARAWVGSGTALGTRLGTTVSSVTPVASASGATFYAVSLAEGGTVFLSSDTDDEPVVGFTSGRAVDLSADARLRAFLEGDAALRRAIRRAAASKASGGAASQTVATASARSARSRWAALLGTRAGAAKAAKGAATSDSAPPVSDLSLIDDRRVDPMLKTQWNQQEDHSGEPCFNYYTPPGKDGENRPCGCTATAAAQIMRYHKWPTAEQTPVTVKCSVNGATVELTTKAGVYDWASMATDALGDLIDDETKREAIGRLTFDIAVALATEWTDAGGGGASPQNLGRVYRSNFGYANAFAYFYERVFGSGVGGLHTRENREKMIYANLDARCPVQLGIYGYPKAHVGDRDWWAGHSVVGDGYGFRSIDGVPTAYVHINLGWGGTDTMWYNIPEINTAETGAHVGDSGTDFLYMGAALFNAFPEETGVDILSGRVVDYAGRPFADARVVVENAAGEELANVRSDAHGIYAFKLPGGTNYVVRAKGVVAETGIELVASAGTRFLPKTVGDKDAIVAAEKNVGNCWGADLTLKNPSVRIVTDAGAVTNNFNTLDEAAAFASTLAVDPVPVEVLRPTTLENPVELHVGWILWATNETAATLPVMRSPGAHFDVAPGASLVLSNLVFAPSRDLAVAVQTNAQLVLCRDVDFGVPATVPAVRTYDAGGFVVVDEVTHGFALDSVRSPESGAFGTALCGVEAASAWAPRIANAHSADGTVRGAAVDVGGAAAVLRWLDAPVPPEESAGYFVVDGVTNAYARLDGVFEHVEEAVAGGASVGEVVVRALPDLKLTRPMTVTADLVIRAEGDVAITNIAGSAGFTVAGGRLTVDGIAFSGYVGNGLFVVDGDAAALTLGPGVSFDNVAGTNYHSGAVAVLKGSATVNGATFVDCRASGQSGTSVKNANGGAIYVGNGASLMLDGGRIVDCWARANGGGVYAYRNARVEIGGNLVVRGNTAGTSVVADSDVYLYNNSATLRLVTGLTGGLDSVGVRYGGSATGNEAGEAFVEVDTASFDATGEDVLLNSLDAFFSDVHAELKATDEGAILVWTDEEIDYRTDDLSLAVVRVSGAGAAENGLYWSVKHAFDALTNVPSATVTLLKDADFANDLLVPGTVVFESEGGVFSLTNASESARILVTGSLTLANVVLGGGAGQAGLLRVDGGALALESGAVIEQVVGLVDRASGAVSVWNGGTFRMASGATIRDCVNRYWNGGTQGGYCGGLLLDASTAWIEGGTITGCQAGTAGGAFFGNGSTVYFSGDATIAGNFDAYGESDDVRVADLSELHLADVLTGEIGYTEGALAAASDPNVFGVVDATFSGDAAALADSARCFRHDVTGDYGQAVRGDGQTLLVWSAAVDDGTFVARDGSTYALVDAGTPVKIPVPTARDGLVYDGQEWTGVPDGVGYTIVGNVATAAGDYEATATLRDGFTWSDGSAAPTTVAWSIAKATYDMSGVAFVDAAFPYDGKSHRLDVSGELPDGVTVTYVGNDRVDVGVYTVVAQFAVADAANYDAIPDMSAMLAIGVELPDSDAYTVQFHYNVNAASPTSNQTFRVGEVKNLLWKDAQLGWSRDGYQFLGWATTSASGLVKYVNGQTVSDLAAPGQTVHLYAVWFGGDSYRVVYHRNYDSSDTTVANHRLLCGQSEQLAWKDAQLGWANPQGKSFLGWATTSASGLVKYANGERVTDLAAAGQTVHLYAVWYGVDSYCVVYHRNYDSSDTTTVNHRLWSGQAEPLAWKDSQLGWANPDGMTFLGWAETASATTAKWANGASVTDIAAAGATKRLYAVWKATDPGPEPPGPEPVVVQPSPIAFQSVTQLSTTEWALVVTNRTKWCNYRLLWTDDLAKGFTATGGWETATSDGAWATNVTIDVSGPAVFWKAEAKEGVAE